MFLLQFFFLFTPFQLVVSFLSKILGFSSVTSSSSIPKKFKYDVFISFRGEDTRKSFVDHLYYALQDKGIYAYKDDGERSRDHLFKSIEDSKFHIIVFSKNYASNSRCLEELVKIMECHKMTGHIAYPVFYDVEPTEVRKQSGAVGEAFAKHENEEAAGKWRKALKEAADLAGWELKNTFDGHEAKFIKKIVQAISLELHSISLGFDEKLVGMESRVRNVVSSLKVGIDEVRMTGIKGMRGAGKTTTARAVFDHLSNDFEAKIFVENVREVSTTLGLKKLQEQVLSKVLNEHVTLDSVNDGKNMMKRRMCGKRVLLVLDDVDHIDQLKALAGDRKWFKPGSRILITTRDVQVLIAHKVNIIHDTGLLSQKEAISLFSRYAFGRENPLQGYEEVSEKVVRYAAGLPLTLEVLGSFLCDKDKPEWVDAINRLEKIPLKDTLEKLELSYISMEIDTDEARMIGDKGKGGARKTTTTGAVFDHLSNYFEANSFVENVRKVSNASMFGLKNLGIMLMLMVFIYYFYSMASSSNSTAPEIMSTSTSSIQKRFKYDVFLSFRGEDTRKNFVDHLYHALKDKGIYTYKDDEKIQKGKRISDDLLKSIEDSKFYVIVFSKNYASSSWCLEELVKIMECQKMTEHTAYPVFYDVEPREVRKQSGAVGEAFAKHEKKAMLKKWKRALKEAADLAGWELKNTLDGHEAKFITKIVQEISLELRSINSGFDEKLVGMETRVRDVILSLEIDIDEVRMIGIKGMGGAGKTTTVRAVFDHLSNDFEAKSFVGNVREVSKASIFGLKNLQEQVLSNVLNEQVTLDGVDDGKNMMKKRMCSKKVLLVLDDVDHIEQLKALAGEPKWFKPGSRILITTRDEQVLVAHRVNVIRDIVLLSKQEAISLFSRHAFGRENPLQGYEKLSRKVVRYAAGLPLTIEVLGSFLCGKDNVKWEDAIRRLKKIPVKETQEKLELSYISLEDEYKEIFLDIACILKGKHKKEAIRILESCGFHARIGLKVLEQRSLITISKCGVLGMHDHIEEMGKNIVRRSHPDEPHKHSRLWIREEIEDILADDKGTEETRSLKLDTSRENSRIVMKGFGKMKKLRYLEVYFADYESESDCESDGECLGSDPKLEDTSQLDIPNSLKYLKCIHYPFLYLPKTFQANNLVGLEMEFSRRMVQLWEEGEEKVLKKLKFLSLDNKLDDL